MSSYVSAVAAEDREISFSGSPVEPVVSARVQPWWAVYTRHQHEKTVGDMLEAKGFEVFLPLYQSTRRWKDRRKVLSLPLFPCYVFVRGSQDARLKVLTTPGVHMILSRGEQFATIPEDEILAIRRSLNGTARVEPHPFLRCGQRVRVNCGSLEGVEGILTRKKNQFRLVLSVEMLAQSVSVEINAEDVTPVHLPVKPEQSARAEASWQVRYGSSAARAGHGQASGARATDFAMHSSQESI